MAFCAKCGASLPENVNFCPSCGAAVGDQAETQTKSGEGAQNTAQSAADKINETVASFTDTADTTADFDPADIEKNKGMAALSYLGILFLIPLLAAKDSKYARFHVNQGIVLLIAEAVYGVVSAVLNEVFRFMWIFGDILSAVVGLAGVVFLVLMIVGIINAASGKAKELPIIGKIRILN